MSDTELLELINSFINDICASNKSSIKIAIMSRYTMLKPIFKFIWDPHLKFHVTSASIKKREADIKLDEVVLRYKSLPGLLEYLTDSGTTASNATRDAVLYYISQNLKYKDLIYTIMDKKKKLKIGMGLKNVQRAFPGLFKSFDVALGYSFKSAEKYFNKSVEVDKWLISRKYDGVRAIILCVGTLDNLADVTINVFSRREKKVKVVNSLVKYIKNYIIDAYARIKRSEMLEELNDTEPIEKKDIVDSNTFSIVLDGEIIVWGDDKLENFKSAVSQFRRNVQMQNLHYKVFDMLTAEEFHAGKSTRLFSERINMLTRVLTMANEKVMQDAESEMVSIVQQYDYTPKLFKQLTQQYISEKWEGLILRRDAPYKGKRSNDIIKVKKGDSTELVVIRIITGTQPTKCDDGTMKDEAVLAAAIVMNKNVEVAVGTGFSLMDKRKYYKNPELLLKKIIRVDYMEETEDGSLRHPVFQGIVGDKLRDI